MQNILDKIKYKFEKYIIIFILVFCFFVSVNIVYAANHEDYYTSSIMDVGHPAVFGNITWNSTVPASTTLEVKVRSDSNSDMSGATDWASCNIVTNGADISSNNCVTDGDRYVQYYIIFGTDRLGVTPVVTDINIEHNVVSSISSIFNSEDERNYLNFISWSEILFGSSDLVFQIRTSPEASTWTDWCGPDDGGDETDCDRETYFTDPSGAESIDDMFKDYSDDKYFQYKAFLLSDDPYGNDFPTLNDVTINYEIPEEITRTHEDFFSSTIIDTGISAVYAEVNWTADIPANTSLQVKIRTSTSSDMSSAPAWSSCNNVENGVDISSNNCVNDGDQYFQYHIILGTDALSKTPTVYDINVVVEEQDSLISSIFDTESAENNMGGINWIEDLSLPEGTRVVMNCRTATTSDLIASESWTEIASSTSDGFLTSGCTKDATTTGEVSCPKAVFPLALRDNINDRFFQYKIDLITTNSNTPTVSEIEVIYIINGSPEFDFASSTQNSDGLVNISYSVRDEDTDQGVVPGEILPSFEFSLDNGSSWFSITAGLSSGATSSQTVATNTFTTFNITWDPKTQIDGQYSDEAVIRVTAYDYDVINNTAMATTSTFLIDVRNPDLATYPFAVKATSSPISPAILISDVSDDTNLYMRFDVSSTTLLTKDWGIYNATSSIFLTNNPTTVYAQYKDEYNNTTSIIEATTPKTPEYVMIQDTSNLSSSPEEYRLFIAWKVLDEIPNTGFSKYDVYRSDDGGVTYSYLDSTIGDENINYYGDSTTEFNTMYYYKVAVHDVGGSISFLSGAVNGNANGIQDAGEGGGGTDSTPPVITNVEVTATTTQSAIIEWDTDELSDSTVGYSTTPGDYSINVGNTTMANYTGSGGVGRHSVGLTNLDPSTTYYFRVISSDPNSNTATDATSTYSFSTKHGPKITGVSVQQVTNVSATINWGTDISADSEIVYSSNPDLSSPNIVSGYTDLVTSHLVTFNGLTAGTRYYYYVKSTSGVGDEAIDNNGGEYYEFVTATDVTPPVITFATSTGVDNITTESARIFWNTNEYATSSLEWGTTQSYGSISYSNFLNSFHVYNLTGLNMNTGYYLRLKNTDASGNITASGSPLFYFVTADNSDITAPTIISGPDHNIVTDTLAIITWETDELADAKVLYGTVSGDYSYEESLSTPSPGHSITLESLTPVTTYYYRVVSSDAAGNTATSSEKSFTTLSELVTEVEAQDREETAREEAESSAGGGGTIIIDKTDKIVPIISDIAINDLLANSVNITWKTNEETNGFVEYGESEEFGNVYGNQYESAFEHNVRIKRLDPETEYIFRIISSDNWANLGISASSSFKTLSREELAEQELEEELSFEEVAELTSEELLEQATKKVIEIINNSAGEVSLTALENSLLDQYSSLEELARMIPGPLLSGEPKVIVTAKTATIAWSTDKESNSLVGLSSDKDFDDTVDDPYIQIIGNPDELVLGHSVALYDLEPDSQYHYQVRSKGVLGEASVSRDFVFTTLKEELGIANYNIEVLNTETVNFKWITNIEADSEVRYTPYRNNQLSVDETNKKGNDAVSLVHEINVEDFEAGVVYMIELISKDIDGNTVTEKIDVFSTNEEDLPPIIYQIQTKSALSPGKDIGVQTIISWMTNEPATTRLYYKEGIGSTDEELTEKTVLDNNYTKKHVAVLTNFKPGSVYRFRAESIDSGGNVSQSKVYTVLTPRQTESVFQVIMKNFEDVFGWVKNVR